MQAPANSRSVSVAYSSPNNLNTSAPSSHNLNDTTNIDTRISQASKPMGALQKNFRCNQISLYAKRLISPLAIPVNLGLWGEAFPKPIYVN
eukprot:scaffold51915_cov61-Attheya_sp.AAC.1